MERVVKPFEQPIHRTQEWPRFATPDETSDEQAATAIGRPAFGRGGASAAAVPARVSDAPIRTVEIDAACVDPHLVALTRESFEGAAEYDKLAVALLLGQAEQSFRRVLVGSAAHGDGRTTVALNLATALAASRRRVLVVDADLERPSVARMLGLETETGLLEGVERGLALDELAVRVLPFGFDLVPVREPVENPNSVLAAPGFHALLDAADERYDVVILDSPPLTRGAALGMLARLADTTLLVVRPGATTPTEMAKAIAPLTRDQLFGVVLNRAAH